MTHQVVVTSVLCAMAKLMGRLQWKSKRRNKSRGFCEWEKGGWRGMRWRVSARAATWELSRRVTSVSTSHNCTGHNNIVSPPDLWWPGLCHCVKAAFQSKNLMNSCKRGICVRARHATRGIQSVRPQLFASSPWTSTDHLEMNRLPSVLGIACCCNKSPRFYFPLESREQANFFCPVISRQTVNLTCNLYLPNPGRKCPGRDTDIKNF